MSLTIYNNDQPISLLEYFGLVRASTYGNIRAVVKEKIPDHEKNILVDNDVPITNQFEIFVEVVKQIASMYQGGGDNHCFNLNDTILSFSKNHLDPNDLSKIEFEMNSKQSYLFPKNEKDYFKLYTVPFTLVLHILESQASDSSAIFGYFFDQE
ncbi:putative ORFan [Tupanvirus deep ocean]|uniref:ORFan n=2 Tax=Tupanvirus TaxID=2094720 RepID=A0AC62A9D7_9VIRU|nr:putative ORFan [Tupanvirus deep ocean]QKU34391.1 putative ORFan [Tupanvirus deep ocean]